MPVEEELDEAFLHLVQVPLERPSHLVPHRLLQERHQVAGGGRLRLGRLLLVHSGKLLCLRLSWLVSLLPFALADGHDYHVDRVQDHIHLIGLLAESVGRLGHVAAVHVIDVRHALAEGIGTFLQLLGFLERGQRLEVLLNEGRVWCGPALFGEVSRVNCNLILWNTRVLQEVRQDATCAHRFRVVVALDRLCEQVEHEGCL